MCRGAHGWTCRVDQGRYGHLAAKPTWLYACGAKLPSLDWRHVTGSEYLTAPHRAQYASHVERKSLPRHLRAATPLPFAELLMAMAGGVET